MFWQGVRMTDRVCIIGAGSSGIATAQVLSARGIDFDCFEVGSHIGGNWRYLNDNGMSSAYRSLHINTSRQMMEYKTFPMPEDYPDYPSHWQIADYFDAYVDHFGFRDKITFRTEVVKVVPVDGGQGGYDVTIRGRDAHDDPTGPETRRYRHVVVANGHHWDARWPEPSFPGAENFPGEQIHVHHYKTPDLLEGKRVLVLGIGNSACDVAVESSRVAAQTTLAMRRGAHIIPKYFLGFPSDRLTTSPLAKAPLKMQQLGMAALLRLTQGRVVDYGLPKPDHAVLHAHPTVSDDLLTRLGHGDITVRPNIDRFEGSKVFFADDNHIDLYRRVVDPEHPGLYFVGLVQPFGAIMPLAEAQSAWLADLVDGTAALPSYDEMRRQIRSYDDALRRRYVTSKRHTIQVDFMSYLNEIEQERGTGRARATDEPSSHWRGGKIPWRAITKFTTR